MGYTHYWTIDKELNSSDFVTFVQTCKRIIEEVESLGIRIGNYKGEGQAEITSTMVAFNGYQDGACETFSVNVRDTGWNFCKTHEKPYDMAVSLCLIALKTLSRGRVRLSSDGGRWEWQEAIWKYNDIFGANITFKDLVEVY